jgi:hypothetical protein
MFLDFFSYRDFSWDKYDIICCSFLLFIPQGFRSFCTSIYYILLQIFSLGFLNIIFNLRDVQMLKGECYNTYVCSLDFSTKPINAVPAHRQAHPVESPRPYVHRRALPGGRLTCIKAMEWMNENQLSYSQSLSLKSHNKL